MRLHVSALVGCCVLLLASVLPTHAQDLVVSPGVQSVQFEDGFWFLRALVGTPMGEPLEAPHVNAESGYTEQLTTTGLAYYSPSDNTPMFTDGWSHWALDNTGVIRTWSGAELNPPDPTPVPFVPTDVPDIIAAAANRWGVSSGQMLGTARCESGFRADARGDHGTSWGIFQLRSPGLRDTFYSWGYGNADSPTEASDFVGRWLASGGSWRPWTCAVALGFTR